MIHNRARFAAKAILVGLSGAALLMLQACVSPGSLPEPKYPIYMQDKPAEATQTAAQAGDGTTPAPVDTTPAITAPQSHGDIATTDLPPPPPPPPPPAETTPAASPVMTAPATTTPAATAPAPVRDTGAAYVYVLQAHDTLYGVSRRFGVPVKVLYDINALPQNASLRIGQRILLPASAVDKGPEEHCNGATMVKLNAALVDSTPAAKPAPAPVKPAPAVATAASAKPAPAKSAPVQPVAAATPGKPAATPQVAGPAKPAPAATVATTSPPPNPGVTKPVVTTSPAQPAPPAGFPANTQISQMGRGMFVWPVHGKIVVPFGQLAPNVRNDGINIAADEGSDVVASADGVVVYEGDQVKELGNTIYVKHAGGWYTGYSHLSNMAVKNNEKVTKGEVIGSVGHTGVIDQPQLHFEIRYTPSTDIARPIDPNLVLP